MSDGILPREPFCPLAPALNLTYACFPKFSNPWITIGHLTRNRIRLHYWSAHRAGNFDCCLQSVCQGERFEERLLNQFNWFNYRQKRSNPNISDHFNKCSFAPIHFPFSLNDSDVFVVDKSSPERITQLLSFNYKGFFKTFFSHFTWFTYQKFSLLKLIIQMPFVHTVESTLQALRPMGERLFSNDMFKGALTSKSEGN